MSIDEKGEVLDLRRLHCVNDFLDNLVPSTTVGTGVDLPFRAMVHSCTDLLGQFFYCYPSVSKVDLPIAQQRDSKRERVFSPQH